MLLQRLTLLQTNSDYDGRRRRREIIGVEKRGRQTRLERKNRGEKSSKGEKEKEEGRGEKRTLNWERRRKRWKKLNDKREGKEGVKKERRGGKEGSERGCRKGGKRFTLFFYSSFFNSHPSFKRLFSPLLCLSHTSVIPPSFFLHISIIPSTSLHPCIHPHPSFPPSHLFFFFLSPVRLHLSIPLSPIIPPS